MDNELHHDRISLPKAPEIGRRDGGDIEVWHNPPSTNQEPCVVLCLDDDDGHPISKDLFPSEARALAHLLLNAADHQDRRKK